MANAAPNAFGAQLGETGMERQDGRGDQDDGTEYQAGLSC
jgi:hypothetical protein